MAGSRLRTCACDGRMASKARALPLVAELRADKRLAATREGLAMASECVRALAAEDVSTSFLMPLSGAEDPESQRVCLEGGRKVSDVLAGACCL